MSGGNLGAGFGTPNASTQGAPSGLTTAPSAGGGFSFGVQKPVSTGTPAAASPFSLSGQSQASTPGGFNFGASGTTAGATSGFTFGQGSLGGGTQATPTQPNATASAGANLGGLAGFALGKTPTLSTTNPPAPAGSGTTAGLTLGATLNTAPAGFSLPGQTAAAANKPLGISVGSIQGTSSTGQTLGTPASTAATGISIGTASSSGGIQFSTAKTTAAPTLLGLVAGTSAGSSGNPTGVGFQVSAVTTSSSAVSSTAGVSAAASSVVAPGSQMSYQQLEENINKWMSELEKQEQNFLELATQVNAWDRLLVENGEKITTLNCDMERVKVDQQKLDHELDFIHSQQRELEDLLAPLEKALELQPNISIQQHSASERENTYQLAENIDAQLKRMLSDLKEIIDHLNSSNINQDQNDPIQQITKILNSHMDSLQWIDQNTSLLGRKVDEISKQMEIQKREQERNFRLVYN
ncbi:uncharacterized protein LOC111127431 isoform X1 [Crassostrea virginica]